MRLKRYINEAYMKIPIGQKKYIKMDIEQDKVNLLWENIQKDCKYYLSLVNGLNFYRGMFSNEWIDPLDNKFSFGKKSVRKNRKPKGMTTNEAKNLNKWLVKNGHTDRSKSVMANSNIHHTTLFGDAYVIFPMGKFNYTWINKGDINQSDDMSDLEMHSIDALLNNQNITPTRLSVLSKMFTTNKGIKVAHKNCYEIWFDCNEYYYMKPIYLHSKLIGIK